MKSRRFLLALVALALLVAGTVAWAAPTFACAVGPCSCPLC